MVLLKVFYYHANWIGVFFRIVSELFVIKNKNEAIYKWLHSILIQYFVSLLHIHIGKPLHLISLTINNCDYLYFIASICSNACLVTFTSYFFLLYLRFQLFKSLLHRNRVVLLRLHKTGLHHSIKFRFC